MAKFFELVESVFAIDPEAPAIEFGEVWWTWGDLARVRRQIEDALADADLGEHVRVGGLMRNRPAAAAAIIQVICTSRSLVIVNPARSDERLAQEIGELAVPAIFGFADDWARPSLAEAIERSGCLCIELPSERSGPVRIVRPLDQARRTAMSVEAQPGIAVEMLTSGTTGTPKRIPIAMRSLEQAIHDATVYGGRDGAALPRLRKSVSIFNAPFAHIAGLFRLFDNVASGRPFCMLERFSVAEWVSALRRHKPKVANAPPSALRMILDAGLPREDLSSLVAFRTGTAPLQPELAEEFYERYGIPVLQNYSATEFAGAGAGWTIADYNLYHKIKRGSVGRVNPGISARVVDQNSGTPLPPGNEGLLEIKAAHLGDGESWLRTTDLAVLDVDQFLWIKGRADNAIIRGGFKIIPDDLVVAIEKHPAIREAAVVALPDPRLGQVPAAGFVARGGMAAPSEQEIKDFLRKQLLPYQIPVAIVGMDELPRTPSLKVSQPELRKILIKEIENRQTDAA